MASQLNGLNRVWRVTAATVLAATALTACVPILLGGAAVGGTAVALDRRTSGAQLDDQGIEMRTKNRIDEAFAARRSEQKGRVSATSFNRMVLLTGQVPNDADRQLAETTAAAVPNVRRVVNEIIVNPNATFAQRSTDAVTTTRVKAALVTANVRANNVKVVTELGTVYLMGIVTQDEANAAAEAARNIGGVLKVVKVFELVGSTAIGGSMEPVQTSAPAIAPAANTGTSASAGTP